MEKFRHIQFFLFDIDGVLTDGTILISTDGKITRKVYTRDGSLMQYALKKGFGMGILSAGAAEEMLPRFTKLGIPLENICLRAQDKAVAYEELRSKLALSHESIAYMGDDLPDYSVLQRVGLASCPQDAIPEIKKISHFISTYNGGQGCVRELIQQVLIAQDKWNFQGQEM